LSPPPSLPPSKWIGSIDCGYVLQHLVPGVETTALSSPTGPELAERARELAAHFDEVGTPVMMGGGVLAFTVIGVHFDEETADVEFLILDPHYCGAEDPTTICRTAVKLEGYTACPVGWRRAETFDGKGAYNLNLPGRPDLL
jgi:Ufm1-specific protease 2